MKGKETQEKTARLQRQQHVSGSSQAAGKGEEMSSDVKKLVRSEVRRLMEAQQRSMMSLLETGGTMILQDLELPPTSPPSQEQPGTSSALPPSQDVPGQPSPPGEGSRVGTGVDALLQGFDGRTDSVGMHSDSTAPERRTQDSEVQVQISSEVTANQSQTEPVPPLRLDDLMSSRDSARPGDGEQPARNIPGMIRNFPLLTIPKDYERSRGQGLSHASEYDLIPTREGDSHRQVLPGKQDIVLLRAVPERTRVEQPSVRGNTADPPGYRQTFSYDTRTPRGPPVYAASGMHPQTVNAIPLLRIPPERDYQLAPPQQPIPLHPRLNPSHPPPPARSHQGGQAAGVHYAPPPRYPVREAWGMPASTGPHVQYPLPSGKINIPLLRIDQSRLPPAGPRLIHPAQSHTHIDGYQSYPKAERTPINLPLLRLQKPAPPPLMHPSVSQGRGALPLLSREEILAYEKEKRRLELEQELETRRQGGEPMQLLKLEEEETIPNATLGATSRQRRREKLISAGSEVEEESNHKDSGARKPKIAKTKSASGTRCRTLSSVDEADRPDRVFRDVEGDVSESDELKEDKQIAAGKYPESRVIVVTPREQTKTASKRKVEADDTKAVKFGSRYSKEHNTRTPSAKQTSPVTMHDVETQVADLGAGYAIKPGTHDEALNDHEAHPLQPTSAQIHYETILKLQQPPPVARPSEAETQTRDVRDVGTTIEGQEGLDIIHEKLRRKKRLTQQTEDKPTTEEAEEQYTEAATGLNAAGNIIAPDIFFGLRFRSGEKQLAQESGSLPAASGRDFINVADINAADVFRDIPLHPDSRDRRGRRSRDDYEDEQPERDGSPGAQPGGNDAKRRRGDGAQPPDDTSPDDPTIADLHYRSLFHRDAVPSDGLALLEEEEEMDRAKRRKKIGDELTQKLLEAKLEKSERGFSLQAQISASRGQSRDRIQQQLAQMNQRLGAIDEVSHSMQEDFSNTRLMLHTVENLSDAMTDGPKAQSQSQRHRPDYSLRDYRESSQQPAAGTGSGIGTDTGTGTGTVTGAEPGSGADTGAAVSAGVGGEPSAEERQDAISGVSQSPERGAGREKGTKDEHEEDDGGMGKGADEGDENEGDEEELDRTDAGMGETNLTLGISGISGVSDIIAEVIAGDDVDAGEFGITEQQRKAAKRRVQIRQDSFTEDDLADIPLTSLTDRQLRQIFSPRSQPSPGDEPSKPWPYAAKPGQRPPEEREKIRAWMDQKRSERTDQYRKARGEKIEREHKPFKSKAETLHQVPTSTKEIKKAEEEMKSKKHLKQRDHYEDRLSQAKDLMTEIFEEIPSLPHRPPPPTQRRRPASAAMGVTMTTGRGRESSASGRKAVAATPQPGREVDSRMGATRVLADRSNAAAGERGVRTTDDTRRDGRRDPKATFMFIDSGAYRGPVQQEDRGKDTHGAQPRERLRTEEPVYRSGESGRRVPASRVVQSSMERSVQFADQRRSSDEDLQLVLAEMSDLVTPRSDEDSNEGREKENAASERGREDEVVVEYRDQRSYKDIVRVQRPEVTRKKGTPRKAKTYTEMLQDMRSEVETSRTSTAADLKAKQKLYGSKRLPGWNKHRKQYTRTLKTYTERLAEMKGAQGTGGQKTRLVQRPRPRQQHQQQEQLATATMTMRPSRRQEVERRGLTPEPGPRSSTPHTAKLAPPSNAGSHRGRDDVVSPRPNPGMRARRRAHEPVPYVDRLKQNADEALARTPPKKYRTVYGAEAIPSRTYKAAPYRTPSPRIQPYGAAAARQPVAHGDETSDVSELSPWSVSDDVRRLLEEGSDLEEEGLSTIREPQYELSDIDDQGYDLEYDLDYAESVDVRELEEIASVGSGSIMSNIDWDAVDKMIENV